MIQTIRAVDAPDANGRKPRPGEVRYVLRFVHENEDDYIEVIVGARGFSALRWMLRQLAIDDEADADPACFI